MLIIYGSKIYGKRDEITGWGRCEECGVYGRHSSYNGRKFGHIYYIPLIPSGPHLRVMFYWGRLDSSSIPASRQPFSPPSKW